MAEHDSEEWRAERDERLREWFLGDQAAIDLFHTLCNISETWDDLIDKDRPVSDEDVHRAFVAALVDLPGNPLWRKAEAFLRPVLLISMLAWLDSVDLERYGDEMERERAFHLADTMLNLGHAIAMVVGGWPHARRISLEMRRFYILEAYDGSRRRQ